MRNNENYNYSDRHFEETCRSENALSAKALEAATQSLAINLDDFYTEENTKEVTGDKNFVKRNEKFFKENSNEGSYHAKALESYIQYSVSQLGWLTSEGDYTTEAIIPSRYDDISNRIDIAATIHMDQDRDVTFGLDLTTNPTPETIREKILIGSNDPNFKAPIGFSQLKYYKDKTGKLGNTGPIPKYCIGIDRKSVDDILNGVKVYRGKIVTTKENCVEQFKILHEMAKQNELFELVLYDKQDNDEITPEEQALLDNIEILDNIYLKERERIAKKMAAAPEKYWFMSGVDPTNSDMVAEAINADKDKGDESYTYDETFETILAVTEQLYESCEDDPKKLAEYAEIARANKRAKIDHSLGTAAINRNDLES